MAGRSFWRGERSGKVAGSGLQILSDYPIVAIRRQAFPEAACAGYDCLANKGIVMALLHREQTGYGQVVEANMVDGSAHLATMPRLATKRPVWSGPRGTNSLDGGAPYYDTYETKDGKYMAVGALEPQFYAALLKGLGLREADLGGKRDDRATWPKQRNLFTKIFKSKTRDEWEYIFDGTDACCTYPGYSTE